MDLTEYLPDNNFWIESYTASIGEDELLAYYNRIYTKLLSLPVGSAFHIPSRVNPEHYDLFLKCASAAMHELNGMAHIGKSYYIENRATVIIVR